MKKNRPIGFVGLTQVFEVIERSIESVISWGELTGDAWSDTEEKVEHLNELKDILVILSWRYERKHVVFKFTQKKKIPNVVPVEEIISTYWENRIWVDENPDMSKVYINF